jgi:hypothetical protein
MAPKNQMALTKSLTEIIKIIITEKTTIISRIVNINQKKDFLHLIIEMNGSKKEMISGILDNSILRNNLGFLTEIK